MEGNLITLDNGLVVSVDWLSFTVMSTADVVDVLDMFGYVMDDFTRMPRGARGYKTMFRLNGYSLSVLCDGNPGMGIHIDVAGSAIGELVRSFSETLKINTPFGEGYDIDFDGTFMKALLERIVDNGHVTRLDIAVDDIGCRYFSTDDVYIPCIPIHKLSPKPVMSVTLRTGMLLAGNLVILSISVVEPVISSLGYMISRWNATVSLLILVPVLIHRGHVGNLNLKMKGRSMS